MVWRVYLATNVLGFDDHYHSLCMVFANQRSLWCWKALLGSEDSALVRSENCSKRWRLRGV